MQRFDLTSNWKFNIGDENPALLNLKDWLPAEIPGTVHTDLLNNKLIDEPFHDDNELKQTWISESDWIYKINFNRPENFEKELPVFLLFGGIDTIADIYLNNSLLGRSDNMFLKYEFEVTSLLKDSDNQVEVRFYSPLKYAREEEAKYGKLPVALNSERVYIRKAQYSFGWDWGPSFPTMGIWKPVYLLQRNISFIKHFSFSVKELTPRKANVMIRVNIGGRFSKKMKIKSSLSFEDQELENEIILSGKKEEEIRMEVNNPKLWWPNGEGEQNLYNLEVFLLDGKNNVIDNQTKKVGIKTVRLELIEKEASTFKLKINDKLVFAKGVNWIPADSFLPRISNEKYRALLQLAESANMNIVRVWGGGIYENDMFYQLCDELGLMVWQDFMFACAAYPEQKEFLENVKEEVRQNVQRLQHHPSIVLWCGNNENEWIWYQNTNSSYKKMPGYKIYHNIIPKILEEEDGDRPYWPSTPFSFDEDPNSYTSGNRHEWKIWSRWIDYSEVKNDQSLFVTEFGFQGPANKKTLEKFLSKEKRYSQNKIFEFHNKQFEGPERIFRFLSAHLPVKTGWDDYIYLAQLNQALALKTCLEHWRFNYPVTNGSIIWQLNDCWPVASWSLVDSELIPKISYYFVKNIFNRQIIKIFNDSERLDVQLLNQSLFDFKSKIKIEVYKNSGSLIHEESITDLIPANSKKIVTGIKQINLPADKNWIIIATLLDENEKHVFRNFYTEEEWKYKSLSPADVQIQIKNSFIRLSTDKPVYFLDLYHPDLEFSDRGFILLPGEEKIVQISGNKEIDPGEIKVYSLDNYLENP